MTYRRVNRDKIKSLLELRCVMFMLQLIFTQEKKAEKSEENVCVCIYVASRFWMGKLEKRWLIRFSFFISSFVSFQFFFLHYILQWEQHKEELREQKRTISWEIMFLCYCSSSSRSQYPLTIYVISFSQSIYWPTYDLGFCTFTATYKQIIQIIQKEKQFSTITYLKLCSCCLPRISHLSPFPWSSPTSVGFQLKTAHN